MIRRFAMSLIGSLAIAATVFANAGPTPLPKGRKVAESPVRFEGVEKHADLIFHLAVHALYSETSFFEVKDATAFKIKFKRTDSSPDVSYMALLAVERKEFEQPKKADPSLKWLIYERPKGVLEAKLKPLASTVPIDVKEIPVTTYRVALKDGKLSAEKVEARKCDDEEPTGLLPSWTIGLIGSLSIAWFGIWFARRDHGRVDNDGASRAN